MPYEIAPDVYIFQSSFWDTNSSVIINEAANVIIDPCYFPTELQVMSGFLSRKKSFNKYIVFTHSDFDHVIGYQYFKGAKLIGHENIKNCNKEDQMRQLRETDKNFSVIRRFPFIFPDLDLSFKNSLKIPLKGDELLFFYAPGHTGDSSFIISRERKILFSGDYLSNLEFPFVYYSAKRYMNTLDLAARLVDEFDIQYVVPGHGEVAEGKEEINYRIKCDKEYLDEIIGRIEEYLVHGLQANEIREVLTYANYKGELITDPLLLMHIDNIRLITRELVT